MLFSLPVSLALSLPLSFLENVYRQEEDEQAAAGEDPCHLSDYKKETELAVSLIIL